MSATHGNEAQPTPQLLRYENAPPMQIAGLRQTLVTNTGDDIPRMWARVAPHVKGVAYGVCIYGSAGACFDYVAGIASSSSANLPEGWSTLQLPAQRYAVFAHTGHVSTFAQTIGAVFSQWLPQSGHGVAAPAAGDLGFIELYGEGFDPQRGTGDLEVWLPITD